MKKLLAILGVLVLIGFGSVAQATSVLGEGGDTLPWPWGSECPFPWNSIEGMWEEKEPKTEGFLETYFQFEIIEVWQSGTHVFRVQQYDGEGNLVAEGKGVSPRGQRIVRAMLLPTDSTGEAKSYFVIVRAYTEDRFSCSDKLITVLTMRERGAPLDDDMHMIIKKSELD
ncbi:MAG: hypothetical protein HRT45_01765 [Bdellovibrionales bacterium]|nr:hypothetical protein [Bdellovibrionales bacterium]